MYKDHKLTNLHSSSMCHIYSQMTKKRVGEREIMIMCLRISFGLFFGSHREFMLLKLTLIKILICYCYYLAVSRTFLLPKIHRFSANSCTIKAQVWRASVECSIAHARFSSSRQFSALLILLLLRLLSLVFVFSYS